MTISGESTEQLYIFCRVTGFTSDFLSFIDLELIPFFHGALHFFCWIIIKRYHTKSYFLAIMTPIITDLAPAAGEHKVSVDIFLSKLFRNVQAQRAVSVVDAAFCRIVQNTVCMVDLLKLKVNVIRQVLHKSTCV